MKTKIFACFFIASIAVAFLRPVLIFAQENNGLPKKANKAGGIDISSINYFWKIASLLEKDVEPSNAQWDSLFSTSGYKEFTNRELPAKWLKSYMRIGLMPSKKDTLQEWVNKKYSDTRYPFHYKEAISKKENLKSFLPKMIDANCIEKATDMALVYFPKSTSFKSNPNVAFLFFDKDARGYDPILIDLLFLYELNSVEDFTYLLAHEAHHYIRNIKSTIEEPKRDNPDAAVIWIINQIHAEGVADQIDKDIEFSKRPNSENTLLYQKLLAQVPDQIKIMDSLLSVYSETRPADKKIAQAIQKTAPRSGHPMGYFMAKTILKYLSKEALVANIGNPFDFFFRYQEAALKSGGLKPVFSKKSIAFIKELEQKYSKK